MKRRTFLKGLALSLLAPAMLAEVLSKPESGWVAITADMCDTSWGSGIGEALREYEFMEYESARIRTLEEIAMDLDNIARSM